MKLTWMGHSCFVLEHEDYRIVMDPYKGVPGYPPLKVSAHAVYCSHQHADHNAVDLVTRLSRRKNPFKVREVKTFHDENEGAERGENTIHIFSANDITVAHMGDLGHHLTLEQIEAIGPLTVMLIPVGGVYTINAMGAKSACMALRPRCTIPMHYRHDPYGLPNIEGVEPFLKLWSKSTVRRLEGPSLELTKDLSGVYVPRFVAAE
ncbi:MAG: MBL fold metallo-hydrolase [Oscillospiraceae bacterium]|nr:MBL fold metallo-hydrolase [Oscillospiraceae bacterium]